MGKEDRLELYTLMYSKYENQLYSFISSLLGNPADTADLLQETARKIWKEFDRYDEDKPFLPWACTLARYEVLSFWKTQKTRRKYFSAEIIEELAADWEARVETRDTEILALEQCIEKLDVKDRRLLNGRYSSTKSLKVLAEELQTTPNSLYKRLQKMRDILFNCISRKLQAE